MSVEQVETFFKQVAQDELLQEQMKKLAQEKQGEDLLSAICALGAEHELAFANTDLVQIYQRMASVRGELDDDALEQVNAAGWFGDLLRKYDRYMQDSFDDFTRDIKRLFGLS